MAMMTKEEFMSKYGKIAVEFNSYYKYLFTFKGNLPDGREIYVNIGGDADDIYKLHFRGGKTQTLEDIDPDAGGVFDGEYLMEEFDEWKEWN